MPLQFSSQSIRSLPRGPAFFCTGIAVLDLTRILFQLAVSFFLLPLDTAVLITALGLTLLDRIKYQLRHRQRLFLDSTQFYPRTVLITGVGTTRGLALARQFHYAGHRVIGGDVGLPPIRSGGSMSNALSAFHSISKTQYVCNLMDIIHREKVDVWIPCADRASAMEDGVAKSTIESRTSCKCIHFDADFATCFSQLGVFLQYAAEKDLPIAERHEVRSRDLVHRILNRSPGKTYRIQKSGTAAKGNAKTAITLPKRTTSQTYSDVSELLITREHPWILKQQARVGKYWADSLLIHGKVKALKVRPSRHDPCWGRSRLDEGLLVAIQQLIEKFGEKGGTRLTGHLSVKLMVDENISGYSVRYAIYITGCRQGTTAVGGLLDHPPADLHRRYLEILSPEIDGIDLRTPGREPAAKPSIGSLAVQQKSLWLPGTVESAIHELRRLRQSSKVIDFLSDQFEHLLLWENPRFARLDPLPWWWHIHVGRPLNDLILLFDGQVEAHVKKLA